MFSTSFPQVDVEKRSEILRFRKVFHSFHCIIINIYINNNIISKYVSVERRTEDEVYY